MYDLVSKRNAIMGQCLKMTCVYIYMYANIYTYIYISIYLDTVISLYLCMYIYI